jgi:hypothetical protein
LLWGPHEPRERCISISGLSIDAAVGAEVLRILKPLGIDAAVKAIETQTSETSAAQRQLELSLQQARYEAAHARRQYDAVDPANRLVAGELERRWNEALQATHRIEGKIAAIVAAKPPPLGAPERQQLMQLGADLELAWSHPAATAATRKRILRTALNEIVVCKEGAVINMVLHWQGGDHTALQVKLRLNAAGRHHWPPPEDTIALVRELARLMPDRQIARLLNRSGKPTGYGNGWTEQRVRGFREHHDIALYRDGEWAERGEITLDAAAQIIGVAKMTALCMIRRGDVKGRAAAQARRPHSLKSLGRPRRPAFIASHRKNLPTTSAAPDMFHSVGIDSSAFRWALLAMGASQCGGDRADHGDRHAAAIGTTESLAPRTVDRSGRAAGGRCVPGYKLAALESAAGASAADMRDQASSMSYLRSSLRPHRSSGSQWGRPSIADGIDRADWLIPVQVGAKDGRD